jgi:E3 ubiquitin-protein ligase HUWE1
MFNSDELELILNGKPDIDLKDWKAFTIYKEPYYSSHKIILWFWEILSNMTQKELSNFLMFCTGTSRVPFEGFSKLESNRGEI